MIDRILKRAGYYKVRWGFATGRYWMEIDGKTAAQAEGNDVWLRDEDVRELQEVIFEGKLGKHKRLHIQSLISSLRSVAHKAGPLHSYWDIIFEAEAFVEGRPTLREWTADGLIRYMENLPL